MELQKFKFHQLKDAEGAWRTLLATRTSENKYLDELGFSIVLEESEQIITISSTREIAEIPDYLLKFWATFAVALLEGSLAEELLNLIIGIDPQR